MVEVTDEALRRVKLGEAWMDASPDIPDDWRERVDTDQLDIASAVWCVIGQVIGADDGSSFMEFTDEHIDDDDMIALGFCGGPLMAEPFVYASSAELTQAWREILAAPGN